MARKSEKYSREDATLHQRRGEGKNDLCLRFGQLLFLKRNKKTEAISGLKTRTCRRTFCTILVSQPSEQLLVRDVVYQRLDELTAARRMLAAAKYEGQLRNHIEEQISCFHPELQLSSLPE